MAGTTRSSEPAEAESLNVIALISGGKDSFYSMLLCLQNGHRIVALGNLYPPTPELKGEWTVLGVRSFCVLPCLGSSASEIPKIIVIRFGIFELGNGIYP